MAESDAAETVIQGSPIAAHQRMLRNDPGHTRFAERGDGPNAYARNGRLVKRQQRKADADLAQLQAFVDDDGGMPPTTPASAPDADALDANDTDLSQLNAGLEGAETDTGALGVTTGDSGRHIASLLPSSPRARALRAGVVPEAAEAAAQAAANEEQAQEQQQNVSVVQKGLENAKRAAGAANERVSGFRDTIANAPAPPPGSIWILVVAIILLVILVYPVNGVPRIGWLWLVITRRATLAGENLYGAPTSLTAQEQGWAQQLANLSASQTAAQHIAAAQNTTSQAVHAAAQTAVSTTERWLNDAGLRTISRYVPGA